MLPVLQVSESFSHGPDTVGLVNDLAELVLGEIRHFVVLQQPTQQNTDVTKFEKRSCTLDFCWNGAHSVLRGNNHANMQIKRSRALEPRKDHLLELKPPALDVGTCFCMKIGTQTFIECRCHDLRKYLVAVTGAPPKPTRSSGERHQEVRPCSVLSIRGNLLLQHVSSKVLLNLKATFYEFTKRAPVQWDSTWTLMTNETVSPNVKEICPKGTCLRFRDANQQWVNASITPSSTLSKKISSKNIVSDSSSISLTPTFFSHHRHQV